MSKTRLKALAVAGLSVALLAGCGSARPGVAAQVGDEKISVREVDAKAVNLCTALGDQLEANGTVVTMGTVRQATLQQLALAAQARQVAAEYGVEPGATYARELTAREQSAAALPEDVRADYVEVLSASALASDVVEQVGRLVLEEQGVRNPTTEQVGQAGADAFSVWFDSQEVEVDPRYGLESRDGMLTTVDTSVSVAVSDLAKAGSAAEPDVAHARSLPESQRCG